MRIWTGAGITRRCWVMGERAYKFPRFKYGAEMFFRGILANYSEQTWSTFVPDEPGSLLPNPVLRAFPFGLCNVYRRARPWLEPEESMRPEWFSFFGDPKPQNIGVVDGEIVLIDYDMFPRLRILSPDELIGLDPWNQPEVPA